MKRFIWGEIGKDWDKTLDQEADVTFMEGKGRKGT